MERQYGDIACTFLSLFLSYVVVFNHYIGNIFSIMDYHKRYSTIAILSLLTPIFILLIYLITIEPIAIKIIRFIRQNFSRLPFGSSISAKWSDLVNDSIKPMFRNFYRCLKTWGLTIHRVPSALQAVSLFLVCILIYIWVIEAPKFFVENHLDFGFFINKYIIYLVIFSLIGIFLSAIVHVVWTKLSAK